VITPGTTLHDEEPVYPALFAPPETCPVCLALTRRLH
jgi:hypothetical protein